MLLLPFIKVSVGTVNDIILALIAIVPLEESVIAFVPLLVLVIELVKPVIVTPPYKVFPPETVKPPEIDTPPPKLTEA
jgi:hypothetical protein